MSGNEDKRCQTKQNTQTKTKMLNLILKGFGHQAQYQLLKMLFFFCHKLESNVFFTSIITNNT